MICYIWNVGNPHWIMTVKLLCFYFSILFSPFPFHYALRVTATTQYKPTIPPTNIIVMQQLPVQSYSPLTSPNQSPLTKPYKNLCPGREQTAEYQSVPGAAFKKAGLCLNRDALFKRQLRGINRVTDKALQFVAPNRPPVVLLWSFCAISRLGTPLAQDNMLFVLVWPWTAISQSNHDNLAMWNHRAVLNHNKCDCWPCHWGTLILFPSRRQGQNNYKYSTVLCVCVCLSLLIGCLIRQRWLHYIYRTD